jgi:hypothetical protein
MDYFDFSNGLGEKPWFVVCCPRKTRRLVKGVLGNAWSETVLAMLLIGHLFLLSFYQKIIRLCFTSWK